MKTTTTLKLRGNSPAGNCGTEEEWNVSWSEFMSTDTAVENSYRNSWNYTSNYDDAQSKLDTFHERFVSNLATGSGWAVQHHAAPYAGTGQAITIWLFNPTDTLTVSDGTLIAGTPNSVSFVSFVYNPNVSCRWQAVDYNSSNTFSIGPVNTDNPLLFVASDNIVYPSDYNGVPLPGSFTPKPKFYVPYLLNVDDKKITVTPKPVDTGGKCWRWASTLVKKGDSESDNFADWDVISETDYLKSTDPAHLKASEYGNDYAIGMLAYDCDAPAPKISDTYDLMLERVYPLKVDGTSYVLDSDDMNCEAGGVCEQPSPYEDCSVYGADIVGGLGCVIRNFGVFLRSLFMTLFVPPPGPFNEAFTGLRDTFTSHLGFLIYPITFIGSLLNAFVAYDNVDSCTPTVCLPTFTAPAGIIPEFSIDLGAIESHWPTLWAYIKISLTGITVFGLIIALYHKYMRIVKA